MAHWNDKSRKPVNDWFLHARKLGWDVLLIIQNVSMLDSQARDAIAEHTVFCSRLDRLSVPYVGFLFKAFFGERLPLPRVHSARVVYGTGRDDLLADRWVYRGSDLFAAYDTKQAFLESYEHATYSMLTPWHLKGRYKKPWTWETFMRLTKIYWRRFQTPVALGAACFLGVMVAALAWPYLMATMAADAQPEVVRADEPVVEVAAQPQVVQTDTESSAEDARPLTLREQFQGFTLAAVVRNETGQYYLLRGPNDATFTDAQLRSMGYRVFTVSECELMLTTASNFADKAHVFVPGCSPRPRDRAQVDLSTIPSLQRGI